MDLVICVPIFCYNGEIPAKPVTSDTACTRVAHKKQEIIMPIQQLTQFACGMPDDRKHKGKNQQDQTKT